MIGPANSTPRLRSAVLALLLASLAPSTTVAAAPATPTRTIQVTAGEHGGYSRVVFALDGIGYRTVPEAAGLRLVVPDAPVTFDYDDVYPRRRAHRVIGAESIAGADGTALRLRFGCECTTRSFLLDDKLVVDIFDGAPAAADTSEADAARTVIPAIGSRPTDSGARAVPAGSAEAHDAKQPRPEFLRRVESLAIPDPQPPEPADASAVDGFDPEHLRRMLEWAVDHGHLTDASREDGETPPSPPSKGEDSAVSAASPAPSAPAAPIPARSADVAPSPTEDAETRSGGPCPDNGALDMAALGGQGAFDAELADRQDALSRALAAGRGVLRAQYALAGFYLARLMPQEALEVLRNAGGREGAARGWLEAAGLILADRSDEVAAGEFLDSPCKSADARLWRAVVLTAQGLVAQSAVDSNVLLERLATYPSDLRVELGLRLAEAGMDAVAPATLEQLLDLVEGARLTAEARARLLYLRGRFAAERGDFAGARAHWGAAAGLPGEGSARATLALLQADFDHGDLDESSALLALERLAYDWRGDALQLPIARLTAAIYERGDRLSEALGVLEEVALGAAGLPNGRAAARAATDLMRRAYVDGPPDLSADRLAAFWRYEGFVPPGPEGADIRLAYAQALIADGLPGMAAGLLEPIARGAHGPLAEQATDSLAEAYIAAREPAKALALLRAAADGSAITKPRRNLLAARALAELGRFAEAAGVLHAATGDQPQRLQADYLWKAGLWKKSAAAYREQLHEPQGQEYDTGRALTRFAAAAYMAKEPAELDELPAEDAGRRGIVSAFAPLPSPAATPGSRAARPTAARLVEQARGLGELAEQYGLQDPAVQ